MKRNEIAIDFECTQTRKKVEREGVRKHNFDIYCRGKPLDQPTFKSNSCVRHLADPGNTRVHEKGSVVVKRPLIHPLAQQHLCAHRM
jgi:hypothetical protein